MQHATCNNPDLLPCHTKQTNSNITPVDIVLDDIVLGDIVLGDIVLGDMGFDDENNHIGAKKIGAAAIIISDRFVDVSMYRTCRNHRKEIRRNFPEALYHQQDKSETIFFL